MNKKTIVLGVTGGIAAFKSAQLTSNLIKKGYDVEVIMTKNATEFITPLTFESLIKHNVMIDTFDRGFERSVKHVSLAQRADLFVIVPATANIIAKIANGIADDMLTTTFLAASCPKLIAPAMNTGMYLNPITQENIDKCKKFGMEFIDPSDGFLACGDSGKGRLASLEDIEDKIDEILFEDKCLKGLSVCISAGPTQESLDPVRFISNHSSGKMGYELAKMARNMGANVTLVSGPVHLPEIKGIQTIHVTTAQEMFNAFSTLQKDQDIIVKAAAVSDYRCVDISEQKIKKTQDIFQITLEKNKDILAYLGENKLPHQVLCGFAMETQNLINNATEKLLNKNCDLLAANNLFDKGAGFKTDTNIITLLKPNETKQLNLMSKKDVAYNILKECITLYKEKAGEE